MIDLRLTKTYVINLDKDQHKFPEISDQFARMGIHVERLSGVYGKSLSAEYIDSMVHPYGRHTIKNRPTTEWDIVSLGAVGCSLSHLKAWKMLADSDQEMVHVLEDDASPQASIEEMNQFVNEVERLDREWDVIYLGYFGNKWLSPDLKLASGVRKITSAVKGAHSYLISKRGAKKLLEHAFPLVNAIDTYMSLSFMYRDVRAYRYKSSFVGQSRLAIPFTSNVQTVFSAKPMISNIPQGITLACYLVTIAVIVYVILLKK